MVVDAKDSSGDADGSKSAGFVEKHFSRTSLIVVGALVVLVLILLFAIGSRGRGGKQDVSVCSVVGSCSDGMYCIPKSPVARSSDGVVYTGQCQSSLLVDGAVCADSVQCVSGSCVNFVCVAQVVDADVVVDDADVVVDDADVVVDDDSVVSSSEVADFLVESEDSLSLDVNSSLEVVSDVIDMPYEFICSDFVDHLQQYQFINFSLLGSVFSSLIESLGSFETFDHRKTIYECDDVAGLLIINMEYSSVDGDGREDISLITGSISLTTGDFTLLSHY